jgi:dUTP pyrophosphatase
MPVAWFGDDGWASHWTLGLRGIRRVADHEEAVAYCLGRVAEIGDTAAVFNYLRVQKLHKKAQLPTRSFHDDAGLDLYVCEDVRIEPNTWEDVPLGIAIQPPVGVWYRIVGRSSTFRKRRLLVIEGIIDHGYRGPLYVGVTNLSNKPVTVEIGERIAQMLPQYNIIHEATIVHEVSASERGDLGFGSTGT